MLYVLQNVGAVPLSGENISTSFRFVAAINCLLLCTYTASVYSFQWNEELSDGGWGSKIDNAPYFEIFVVPLSLIGAVALSAHAIHVAKRSAGRFN